MRPARGCFCFRFARAEPPDINSRRSGVVRERDRVKNFKLMADPKEVQLFFFDGLYITGAPISRGMKAADESERCVITAQQRRARLQAK